MSRISTPAWMIVPVAIALIGCGDRTTGGASPAEETAEAVGESPHVATPAAEVATYSIPDLSSELGKQLVSALGEQEGVVSARVDEERGVFLVTFKPGETDPAAMLVRLQTVSAGATLTEVGAAATGTKEEGCSGCPSKSKCPKSREASSG